MDGQVFLHPDYVEGTQAVSGPQRTFIPFGSAERLIECDHAAGFTVNMRFTDGQTPCAIIALCVAGSEGDEPCGLFGTFDADMAERTGKGLIEIAAMLRRGGQQ